MINKLIDANELLKKIIERYNGLGTYYDIIGKSVMTSEEAIEHHILAQVIGEINKAKKIDAEPVRHGYWINNINGQECSVCREEQYGFDNFRNYCANCGAKMDLKEDKNVISRRI